jgi:hypothetical protein
LDLWLFSVTYGIIRHCSNSVGSPEPFGRCGIYERQ